VGDFSHMPETGDTELAAFLPAPLVARWAETAAGPEGLVLDAIALVADLVDSTGLTDRYGALGPHGAEDLSAALSAYFASMTQIIERAGGITVRIAGDAVIAVWPCDGDPAGAARRTLAAAEEMSKAPALATLGLSHRLAVDAGPIRLSVLGQVGERRFFLVSGEPLRAMANGSLRGAPGELRVSQSVLNMAGGRRTRAADERPTQIGARTALDLRAFVPPVIASRGEIGLVDWLAEFRVLSVVYIGLSRSLRPPDIRLAFSTIEAVARDASVGIWDVIDEDKGVIVKIVLGLPPHSSERDAVVALDVAVRVHHALAAAGLQAGIGVATGRAFCGEVGSATRREHIAVGTVMNYGARLMQASDGDVLCDETTARAAADTFLADDAIELTIQGRETPIKAYRVADFAEISSLDGLGGAADSPVGRQDAATIIEQRIADLADGPAPPIVIVGEPGVGKTTLLSFAARRAEEAGVRVISARGSLTERSTGFHVLRRVLASLAGADGPREGLDSPHARIKSALRADGQGARLHLLEDIFPLGGGAAASAALTGAARRTVLEDLIVRFVDIQANSDPLLVLIDDFQWVDAASRELLGAVRQRSRNVLFVLATRNDGLDGQAGSINLLAGDHTTIALDRLLLEHTAAVAHAALGVSRIPGRLAAYLHHRSGGLPLHARQLLLSLTERGVVKVINGRCEIEPGALTGDAIPDSLRGLVTERIDRLAPFDQITGKSASVIGARFGAEALAALHPSRPEFEPLAGSLRRLEAAGFIEAELGDGWAFQHAILRDTLYDLMPFSQRAALHTEVAQRLEAAGDHEDAATPAVLAWHWEGAGVPSRAIDKLLDAARRAIRSHAAADALDHAAQIERLSKVADESLSVSQRIGLERLRADGYQLLARFTEAGHHFRSAASHAGLALPQSRPAIIGGLAIEGLSHGAARLGLKFPTGGSHALERDQLAAHIHMRLAEHAYFASDTLSVLHGTLKSLNHAHRSGSVVEMTHGYAGLAVGFGVSGMLGLAREYAHRALKLAHAHGGDHDRGLAHMMASVALFPSGDWEAAGGHAARGAALFHETGDTFRRQSCTVLQAYSQLARGEYVEARLSLSQTPDSAGDIEAASVRAWAAACHGVLESLHSNAPDAALEDLRDCLADPLEPADRLVVLGPMAQLQLATGDRAGATLSANEALTMASARAPKLGIGFVSLPRIVETFLAVDDRDRAQSALKIARGFAATMRIARPHTDYVAGQLEFAAGRRARAHRLWRRGLSLAEAIGMPLEASLCRAALDHEGKGSHDAAASSIQIAERPGI
jgi:class 3 adenylate cyclase